MASSTLSPFAKVKRFSTSQQEKHPMPPTEDGESVPNPKRSSRLNEFMSRSRTASLPPRPQTSNGPTSRQKLSARLGGFKGKGREKADLLSPDGDGSGDGEYVIDAASSSMTSVADPFAVHPTATASASFVTYSPTTSSPLPPILTTLSPNATVTRKSIRRPRTAQSIATTTSPSTSFADLPSPPMSPILASPPTSPPASPPTRRRGSILGAASDAFSSFARKTPNMKPRLGGLGRHQSGKGVGLGIHTTQPIVLTEVIEISESAVRATKLREEEEEERQRLRDAAARALGIGDPDADKFSVNSRTRLGLQDPAGDEDLEHEDGREVEDGWFETKTSGALRSEMTHSRTRSGSFLPPHSLQSFMQSQNSRPSTPIVNSQLAVTPTASLLSTSAPRSPLLPPSSPPPRNQSAKSFSSPPALSVNTASTLAPVRRTSQAQLRDSMKPVQDRTFPPPKIPPFPTSHSSLQPFIQRSATIPRYYPAPSLLMFALSKQWKNRFLVLTSPLPSPSAQSTPTSSPWANPKPETPTPAPSYLHIFKSHGSDERELERLEINEDSVVYIAEHEVGGRGSVIKVGGLPTRKPHGLPNPRPATSDGMGSRTSSSSVGSEEGMENGSASSSVTHGSDGSTVDGRTMWALQIQDPEETRSWIAAIKTTVLSQRSIRAGLGSSSNLGGIEPRGDLDVVLSLRALHSPISPRAEYANGIANGVVARLEGGISPTNSQFTEASKSSPTSSLTRSQSTGTTGNSAGLLADVAPIASGTNGGSLTQATRSSMSATTAIKSLFTIGGGRPRSPSSASTTGVSIRSLPVPEDDIESYPEDSFTHAGTNLLGMLHSNGYPLDRPISPAASGPVTPRAGTPVVSSETHPVFLERKILQDHDRQLVENENIPTPVIDIPGRRDANVAPPRDNILVVAQRVSSDGGMKSPSLQPPPRKRAGTVSTMALSISSPSEAESYTYTHANRSTAESLGVQNPNLLAPSSPMPPAYSPNSATPTRLKDRRARTSWSSVSTYGSNDHTPSSPDESRSRRWSRRSSMPQRMSPPYPPPGSPPGSPKSHGLRMPAARHPYAADTGPLNRCPSAGSQQSYISDIYGRPSFSTKRASVSSVHSYSTTGTSPPGMGSSLHKFGSRPRSSHRASMPPPQRPAPNSALPPTPGEGLMPPVTFAESCSAPPAKSSFRESLKLRAKRHSAAPPSQPPPSGGLPPRPDEPAFKPSHRRSSSYGSVSASLAMLGATSNFSQPAFPPPNGPLPPTPGFTMASPTPSRHSSITRHFRRMSSPIATNSIHSEPASPDPYPSSFLPSIFPPSPILETPVNAIPIGEPITTSQNDPNFLNLSPPTPPGSDFSVDAKLLEVPGPTALSPPPRRASRQAPVAAASDGAHSDAEKRTKESRDATTNEADTSSDVSPTRVRPPPEVDDFAPTGVAV
ncbi:hypothetical protein PHLGIDRAFT_129351 [Phlebiopsis gigantea 11061_1 CR5-6]|uniref:PH domain-containing protein n=1 Tax=Phlebiopsis gigantea (strain 11061_1 CR5-6) TaxID=745531 RepID=A0A0C3RUI1_PHLG1|nr:hypothetical protein PHLGIDRAFT_129351 [Phlebiopsis gigantea 11061_1 CR5-6]